MLLSREKFPHLIYEYGFPLIGGDFPPTPPASLLNAFQHAFPVEPPQTPKCLLTTFPSAISTRSRPFYLYISISLQILVLFKLHQLFNFSSRSGGTGFPVAEQDKAKVFQGGFEIHGGFSRVPLTWALCLPQTMELIKTHAVSIWLGRQPAAENRGGRDGLGDEMLLLPCDAQSLSMRSPWCKESSRHLPSTDCVPDITPRSLQKILLSPQDNLMRRLP